MSNDSGNGNATGNGMHTEQKLSASELRYRRLFEAAQDGILILDVDTGRINDVNPFLCQLLGFSHSELVGQTVGEVSPFKDIVSNQAMLERLQKDGYVRYENLPMETSDGRRIEVEFISNVYRENGHKVIQCNVRDNTEHHRAEKASLLLAEIVESSDDAIIGKKLNGIISSWNRGAEKMFGYTAGEMVGQSITRLFPPDRLVEEEDILVKIQRGESVQHYETVRLRKDGISLDVSLTVSPIHNSAGRIIGISKVMREITERKRAEVVTRKLLAVVEATPDIIGFASLEGSCEYLNPEGRKLVGLDQEESIRSILMQDFVHETDRERFQNQVLPALFRDGHWDGETLWKNFKTGAAIPMWQRIFFITEPGAVQRMNIATVVRDISERKRLERKQQDSDSEFQAMFEMASIGLGQTDPLTGRFLRVNPKLCLITGYTAAEMLKLQVRDITHLDDREKDWELFQRVVKGELPDYHMEKRYLRKNGGSVWVNVNMTVIRDEAGRPFRAMASIEDITERRHAESRLLLQSAALEAATNAIVITDTKGLIEWANPAFTAYTGYSVSEARGNNPRLLKSGKHDDKFYRNLWETVLAGKVWCGEIVNRRKDGSLYTEEMTITPIRDNKGKIEHFIAVKHDITERKKLEVQFIRAQRMESIGTLASGIAHDLNNILAPIVMSIDLLKSEANDPKTKTLLNTIATSAQRGAEVIRQILTFARGIEGERIEIQLKHLLKEMGNIIQETFPKNIQLELSTPNDTWMIVGDPTQIHQILLNLCINARDAMPNGGSLRIGVENAVIDEPYATLHLDARPGHYVQISVTDSGTGMTPDVIDKIFDPFFTTKTLTKGTGLGLSTVMGIVKSHKGFIQVYSEPGKGTTFKVYLPAMRSPLEERMKQTQLVGPPQGNDEMVLVVDDEDSILTITSQTLQNFGYRVLTAKNGVEAVAVYRQHRDEIAVVLTDMAMPLMGGLIMIHDLMRINPEIKVIAASGLQGNVDLEQASALGVKHFLTKPYTGGTLLKTLRTILEEP